MRWVILPEGADPGVQLKFAQVLAIHAALLPTGEIIYCGGDQHDRDQWRLHHDQGVTLDATRIFDCANLRVANPGSPTGDVFCCGHAMLGDGRVLLAGGTEIFVEEDPGLHHSHMPGLNSVCAYEPFSRTWNNAIAPLYDPSPQYFNREHVGSPEGGRWYPTLLTLGDGSIFALSGHPSEHDIRHNNHIPERFSPLTANWTPLPDPKAVNSEDYEVWSDTRLYPRVHLLPNGLVFCSTPLGNIASGQLIDPISGLRRLAGAPPPKDTVTNDPPLANGVYWGNFFTQCASSILLPFSPPDYAPRVLICGGAVAYVMDLSGIVFDPSTLDAAGDPAAMLAADQQHVFYRRKDGAIYHILWDQRNTRFYHDNWTARTAQPAAAGNPAAMATANQQHIFYRSADGDIRHIFWDAPTNRLYADDWTARTSALKAAGDPAVMVTANPDQQHIFYRTVTGAIQHIFFDAPTNRLYADNWTASTGAPGAIGDPATLVTLSPKQQHIFYRGSDNAIQHIFYDGPTNRLYHDNWTALTGAPAAAGDPATLVTVNPNQQHIFFRAADNAIHHIFYDGPTNRLYHDKWTALTGAPPAAGDPATLLTTNPIQQHIFYRSADGAMQHIFWDAPTNHLYRDNWTQSGGAPPAAGDPCTLLTPNQQHIFYRATDSAIHHIFWDAPTNRIYHDNWNQGTQNPGWFPTQPRNPAQPRYHLNTVLLPTGDVFVCGGCSVFNNDDNAVRAPEIYHPETNSWQTLASQASVTRDYHSVALLMPDGRVWTAGSDFFGRQGLDNRELRIETFEPDYFGRTDRPQIAAVPEMISHCDSFDIDTPDAAAIGRAALLRTGSVTHSYNSDQRYIRLDFTKTGNSRLRAIAPPTGQIAPPGYYLLFLINNAGIPSIGRFIRVSMQQQHLFYRAADNCIHHIFWDAASNQLIHDNWTQRTSAPPANGDPAALATSKPDQQHVFYPGADGAIQHIFLDGPTNGLYRDNWSQRTGAPAAAGHPATMRTVNPSQQHVFYRTAGGAIQHIFWDASTNQLHLDDWTARTGAPAAAGDPATLATSSQQHIFYRSADGAIQHIFWDAPTQKLYRDNWTERAAAPSAAGDPATLLTIDQLRQHVFYRGTDGAIHHIFWDAPTNQFHYDNWTRQTGELASAGDPATMLTAGQQHIFYRATDNSIRHILWDQRTNGLFHDNWTQRTGEALAAGSPTTMVTSGQQHVFYRGTDGNIHHILWNERINDFYHDNWTQRTGAPAPISGLASIVTPLA